MPHWSLDPLGGRWVIQAPERSKRPRDGRGAEAACPFCPGREHRTPPETDRVEVDGCWQVRVFPNLYPAVERQAVGGALGDRAPVTGAHEVVVLSPAHDRALGDLDDAAATMAIGMLLRRARHHETAGRYSQAFVNHGAAAGASLAHPHGQVVAVDVEPPVVARERAVLRRGGCAVCAHAPAQIEVAAAENVAAWCPPWSTMPFELLVAPRDHDAGLDASVGTVLADALRRLRGAVGEVAYNLVFHPRREGAGHAHAHVYPRVEVDAGFELGTGFGINSSSPAEATERLRAAG